MRIKKLIAVLAVAMLPLAACSGGSDTSVVGAVRVG